MFKKENISIIISIIALLSSIFIGISSYKKDFPKIFVNAPSAIGTPYYSNKENRWLFFYYQEILISNIGGRSVSLLEINKGTSPGFLLTIVDDKIDKSKKVDYKFFLLEDNFNKIKENPQIIEKYKHNEFEAINPLNIVIKSGETYILRYGFNFYPYENRKRKIPMILLSLELTFNTGYKEFINSAIEIPMLKAGASDTWYDIFINLGKQNKL